MNIKTLNIYCTFILCLILSSVSFAQDAPGANLKAVQENMNKSLDELSPDFQYQILTEALKNSDVDVKKMLKKTLKKMSPEQRANLLSYTAKKQSQAKAMGDRTRAVDTRVITPPTNRTAPTKPRTPVADKASMMQKTTAAPKAATPAAPVGPLTTCEFDVTEFNFGIIPQGESVTHVFKLKNTGKSPLIISNAKGSCGCTVPKWPKEPVAVGATADIEVTFNSRGKKGKQNKRVTLTTNTDPVQTFIYMKGEVDVPAPVTPGGGK